MPNTILDRFRISERVFAIVPIDRPVTFQSQQLRAFNLVWALHAACLIRPDSKVAVVGGGLAGITAAAAAYLKSCEVSVFERLREPMSLQRRNQTRYIHPNMHRWPHGVLQAKTSMPELDWQSSNAGDVVEQIHQRWKRIVSQAGGKIREYCRYDVELVQGSSRPILRAQKRTQAANVQNDAEGNVLFRDFDVVVLAVGFGVERCLPDVPFTSYWENDSFDQAKRDSEERVRVLISGCGDGGLIDAQRLCIQNFDHQKIVDELMYSPLYGQLREEVSQIENRLANVRNDEQFQLEAFEQYRKLVAQNGTEWQQFTGTLPHQDLTQLKLRDDVAVTLNSDSATPLTRRSSALNRFITFALLSKNAVRYEQGKIQVSLNKGKYEVDFGNGRTKQFDQLIVRHGPVGVLERLVGKEPISHLKKIWSETVGDPTVEPRWPDEFFPASRAGVVSPSLDHVMRQFPAAFPKLYDKSRVRSICVGSSGGRNGYIVRLKGAVKASQAKEEAYFGEIPVFFRGGKDVAELTSETSGRQIITIGTGIYNAKQIARNTSEQTAYNPEGDSASRLDQGLYLGSLGMFVRRNGKLAVLSTSTSMSVDPRVGIDFRPANVCDEIFAEPLEVRSFARFVSGSEFSSEAETSAASAAGMPDLRSEGSSKTPDFLDFAIAEVDDELIISEQKFDSIGSPILGILTGDLCKQPDRVAKAQVGDLVYKVGRTTGLTWGRVTKVSAEIEVFYSSPKPVRLKQVLAIEGIVGLLPGSTTLSINASNSFTAAGDTGSVVFRLDGAAVGLLFADCGPTSYALNLSDVLTRAGCAAEFDIASIEVTK